MKREQGRLSITGVMGEDGRSGKVETSFFSPLSQEWNCSGGSDWVSDGGWKIHVQNLEGVFSFGCRKSYLCLKVVLGKSRANNTIIMHLLFLGVQLSREICNSFLGSLFPG